MTDDSRKKWVREYYDLIFNPKYSSYPEFKEYARTKKLLKLIELGSLYIYRTPENIEKYLIPQLKNQGAIETFMPDPRTFSDKTECRMPLEYYQRCYSVKEHFECLKSSFKDFENNSKWLDECTAILGTDCNNPWNEEIINITLKYFPDINSVFNNNKLKRDALISYIGNPWKASQENDLVRTGVRCFTEDNNSEFMWREYGGEYTGVCIEYNTKQFLNPESSWIRTDNGIKKITVDYLNNLYPIIYSDDESEIINPRLFSDNFSGFTPEELNQQVISSVVRKRTKYEPEHEWRFVVIYGYIKQNEDIPTIGKMSDLEMIAYHNREIPFCPYCFHLGKDVSTDFERRLCDAVKIHNENVFLSKFFVKKEGHILVDAEKYN